MRWQLHKTRQLLRSLALTAAALCALGAAPTPAKTTPVPIAEVRERIRDVAGEILDQALVSYVYGGYQIGDSDDCKLCNECLAQKEPSPKARLKVCGMCSRCSLDCSHFAALVFTTAGLPYPYLDTKTMLALSGSELRKRYGLVDLDLRLQDAQAGDFLVYDGHMVILEKRHAEVEGQAVFRGDVVHATGGRVVRGPGEGIQRERFVSLEGFRGPLRRILRHEKLTKDEVQVVVSEAVVTPAVKETPPPAPSPKSEPPRLRRVERRSRR